MNTEMMDDLCSLDSWGLPAQIVDVITQNLKDRHLSDEPFDISI